jgi:hypothetical protein
VGPLGLFVAAPLTVTAIGFLKTFFGEDGPDDGTVESPGGRRQANPPGLNHAATAEK